MSEIFDIKANELDVSPEEVKQMFEGDKEKKNIEIINGYAKQH
jgi:hypothetical protein